MSKFFIITQIDSSLWRNGNELSRWPNPWVPGICWSHLWKCFGKISNFKQLLFFHFNPVFIFHNLQIDPIMHDNEPIENAMFLFYREKISLLLSSSARTHCQLLCWWKAPTSTLWPKSKMLSGMALGLSKMPLKTVSYNGKMCLTLKFTPLKRLFQ